MIFWAHSTPTCYTASSTHSVYQKSHSSWVWTAAKAVFLVLPAGGALSGDQKPVEEGDSSKLEAVPPANLCDILMHSDMPRLRTGECALSFDGVFKGMRIAKDDLARLGDSVSEAQGGMFLNRRWR